MTSPPARTLVEVVGAWRGQLQLVGEHARRLAASARATGFDPAADARKLELQFEAKWNQEGRGEGCLVALLAPGKLSIGVGQHDDEPEAARGFTDPDLLARGIALATTLRTREPELVGELRPKWFASAAADPAEFAERAAMRAELARCGADEPLLARPSGEVVGTTHANVFFVVDEQLVTPSLASGAFPGLVRAAVLQAARDLGVAATERVVTAADVASARDAFITRSFDRIVAVRALDGRELAPPPPGSRWRRLVPQLRLRVHELCRARFLPTA